MCSGDGEETSASLDDMVALPTGEALFGKASDREAGLTIFFMSYIRLVTTFMQTVLACRTKRWQNLACPPVHVEKALRHLFQFPSSPDSLPLDVLA